MRLGSPLLVVAWRDMAQVSPPVPVRTCARPLLPPCSLVTWSRYSRVPAVSASKIWWISSARPMTPSSATDLPGLTTSSIPGRVQATRHSPLSGRWGRRGRRERANRICRPHLRARGARSRNHPRTSASRPGRRSSRGRWQPGRRPGRPPCARGRRLSEPPSSSSTPRHPPAHSRYHPHLATSRCKRVKDFLLLYR